MVDCWVLVACVVAICVLQLVSRRSSARCVCWSRCGELALRCRWCGGAARRGVFGCRGVASWRVGLAVEAACTFWCAWIPRWVAPWVGRAGLWCRALRPKLFGSNVCSERTSFLRPGVLCRCVSGWLCSSSNRCGVKVCFICVPMGTGVCPWVSGFKTTVKIISFSSTQGRIDRE